MAPPASVRLYYQVVEDSRERGQGRFFRFQVFDESDAGRRAAQSARFQPTTRLLGRGEFERNRDGVVRDVKRAMRLDVKEKELQADTWTKDAVTLMRARKFTEATAVLKRALTAVPSHAEAKRTLTQVERMIKESTLPTDEYQLFVRIQRESYHGRQGAQAVTRSGDVLVDYVFCRKGQTRAGFQAWGRPYRKAEVQRDHAKLVQAVVRDKNLVVARVQRGGSKGLSWGKTAPAGWQIEDCCPFRDVREPRALIAKDRVPFQS